MSYKDVRDSIKSGDVLAWTHKGWSSWYDFKVQMVRLWTRSEFCHVGVAWVIGGRVFVLEAVSSGVRIMPLSQVLPCYWIALGTYPWTDEVEEKALHEISKPYSYWQAIKAGLGINSVTDDRWQCAEYVDYILSNMGYAFVRTPTPSHIVNDLEVSYDASPKWLS